VIEIHPQIVLDESRVNERFVTGSGPGGQHVNKTATAVQLSVPLDAIELPDAMRARLIRLAGGRLARDGVLLIEARDHRSQYRNRAEAWQKLTELLVRATEKPKPRRNTKPSRSSKRKRLSNKRHRGAIKARRGKVDPGEE